MKKLFKILSVAWLMMLSTSIMANDIVVSNVSLEGQDLTDHFCYVEFDVAWSNSWRTSSIPYNWDAAWVFVKFSAGGGDWGHASLHANGHVSTGGASLTLPIDSVGAFIFRDSDGTGANNFQGIRLRWDYGADGVADDASIEVRVFAIEMVYVPQSPFYLGDDAATFSFFEVITPSPLTTNPYLVSIDPIEFSGTVAGKLWSGGNNGASVSGTTLSDSYPTGYNAFYCMKYEVSQEQYADFLNTLTRTQQINRVETDMSGSGLPFDEEYVMSAANVPLNRNGITCDGFGYGTTDPIPFHHDFNMNLTFDESDDGQNIACNFISWMDVAAYSDWAGLRPITEMEFEKACRGPNTPVANEYAWGNPSIYSTDYTFSNSGEGNEAISNMGVGTGNALHGDTDQNFQGPGRCGIFAASATNATRMETGASYYGIMEMSGNLREMVVALILVAGKSYTGLHGDGELTTDGYANTDYWPGIDSNYNSNVANGVYTTKGVKHAAGITERGGYYSNFPQYGQISDRENSGYNQSLLQRYKDNGGRLVRTAP